MLAWDNVIEGEGKVAAVLDDVGSVLVKFFAAAFE